MATISPQESDLLFQLAEQLTGTCQDEKFRHQVIITNVRRRMHVVGAASLDAYLALAADDDGEFQHLISSLTIHTTSWFREAPHFDELERQLIADLPALAGKKFRAFSAACSTGEEVYSLALVLESIRQRAPGWDYEIVGSDVDPVSVEKARRALYSLESVNQIPKRFHSLLLKGNGKFRGMFMPNQAIRSRCTFRPQNLKELSPLQGKDFDIIFCRNVLIYFSQSDVELIVKRLLALLSSQGTLCLGHSEAIDHSKFHVRPLGNARYAPFPRGTPRAGERASNELAVLVVDDSATVRASMLKLFARNRTIKATAVASADEASQFLKLNQVDLVTLDLHMPGTSGQAWLRAQRSSGLRTPVVIVSGASPAEAIEVLGALENGAQDYIDKASLQSGADDVVERIVALGHHFRAISAHPPHIQNASETRVKKKNDLKLSKPDLIVIGASTGGTECLTKMLRALPKDCPPLLVTQHISPAFAEPFARRLADISGLLLAEPKDGEPVKQGHIYLALGDYHIGVSDRKGNVVLKISAEPPVNRHRPSVDFLFQSASSLKTSKIFGALMTGMGADGARGLQALKFKGCMTLAQNEESCVVFGMPKEAIKLGAAGFIGSPEEIRETLNRAIERSS